MIKYILLTNCNVERIAGQNIFQTKALNSMKVWIYVYILL